MIYVYGIVPLHPFQTAAAAGRKVYLVPYRDIGAVVSEAAGGQWLPGEENYLAHEQVVEAAMAHTTILPMRFGTVLKSEQSVAEMLAGYYKQFKQHLGRLENCVEMGLKAIWDLDGVKARFRPQSPKGFGPGPDRPGCAFLEGKRKDMELIDFLAASAREAAAGIQKHLADCAEDFTCKLSPTRRLFFTAAYLVKKNRLENFKEAFQLCRSANRSLKFLLSGPWPPYSFIKITEGGNFAEQGLR
ncbi:hypothetical protein PTH_0426 [Pelotomaculum thermopropionicum SI]|uniref:Gas vesicle synthesis protein GvpL/GvpF n=1 Tax=Pelotomaculum thermopropionicum (strain DSM 13744 / JCM 10971 / SI) TaxID=370438 RepID=A5D580_PELTS|nr:hypothetical protein PTH_0426 [Pelotomaculum thermopropionicum SI]